MSDQKHFNYEGKATLVAPDIKIKKILFLMPMLIEYTENGETKTVMGQMDHVKNEIYLDGTVFVGEKIKEKALEYLDVQYAIDPNKHALSEQDMAKVAAMESEHRKFNQEHLGEEE
jgi:hypothetical protein